MNGQLPSDPPDPMDPAPRAAGAHGVRPMSLGLAAAWASGTVMVFWMMIAFVSTA